MTTTVKPAYRVKRLVEGATGTNTINIYNPLGFAAECTVEESGFSMAAGVAVETDETPAVRAAVEVDFETFALSAAPDLPPLPMNELQCDVSAGLPEEPAVDSVVAPVPDPTLHVAARVTTPEEDVDTEAMAAAMREAADLGLPFCEECTRSRLRREKERRGSQPAEPDDIDAEAMAEAMREAARNGTPFCEQCTRARLRQARAKPAPAPPPSETDIDAQAMAQAMRDAARRGAPFCEECTRARLRQQRAQAAAAAATPAPSESDVDAPAMAKAMQDAARRGVPFCEECTRARLRQQRNQN